MWSSSGGNNSCRCKAVLSSSPSKSSTCSSPSPASSPIPKTPAAATRKSMEEVWKDISLSSLTHHPATATAATATPSAANGHAFHNLILQDFLAHPFSKDPPTRPVDFDHQPSSAARGGGAAVFGSSAPPSASSNLNLGSGPEFHYLESTDPMRSNPQQSQTHASSTIGTPSFLSSLISPLNALPSSPPLFPSFSNKRAPESDHDSTDRRYKRMIKNRESAARSRARKQAYTYQLEDEVARLVEVNAKLRRQLEKSCFAPPAPAPAPAPAQLSRKKTLYRTLTAPF